MLLLVEKVAFADSKNSIGPRPNCDVSEVKTGWNVMDGMEWAYIKTVSIALS